MNSWISTQQLVQKQNNNFNTITYKRFIMKSYVWQGSHTYDTYRKDFCFGQPLLYWGNKGWVLTVYQRIFLSHSLVLNVMLKFCICAIDIKYLMIVLTIASLPTQPKVLSLRSYIYWHNFVSHSQRQSADEFFQEQN